MHFMAEIPLNCIYNQIWCVSMNLYLKIRHTQIDEKKKWIFLFELCLIEMKWFWFSFFLQTATNASLVEENRLVCPLPDLHDAER